jgi:spermidine/putrescine transport system substrate-binding protein
MDFSQTDFSGALLSRTNLEKANLSQANLSGADLSDANLVGADLSGANLVGATLENANLTEALLQGANLSGANLTGARLTGLNLTNVELTGVVLERADLVGARLWGVNLSGIHFSGANLSGANLVGSYLSGAIFSEKDLLSGANLSGADLRGAHLNGTNLHGASLRGADLRYAQLIQADLSQAELWGADLSKANLSGADLTDAFLSGASLLEANLSNTILLEAELNGTNLQGANLNQSVVRERKNEQFLEANFLGAKYDDKTRWPTWLGPSADAKLVENINNNNEKKIFAYCGDKSKLTKSLNMTLWTGYMDEGILVQFEIECGVKVIPTVFFTNEELMLLLSEGNFGYDLMVLSDYAVQLSAQQGFLAELNRANIPNITNLNRQQMGLYYDLENKYSLPYQWGTTGIALNTTYFTDNLPDSWAVLFDPQQLCQYEGKALMLGIEREIIGASLKYLGYSYNDIEPAHHQEAKKLLIGQKDCLAGYDFGRANQPLVLEEIIFAHTWSNTAAVGHSGNDNILFIIPKEGAAIWQDNMVIPADSPHQYTAEIFINYLLGAEIGARLTSYTYAFTPNQAAEPFLSPQYFEVLEQGGLLINEKTRSRLEWIKPEPNTTIFADTWSAVQQ